MVYTLMLTVQDMKAIGKKINKMEKAKKHGLIQPVMKEDIFLGKRVDMESSIGLTVQDTKGSSMIITYMDRVSMFNY